MPGPAGIRATVNGEAADLAAGTTLAEVVAMVCESDRGVAVAVGREVVPRSAWPSFRVRDGAFIEVVTAAAGG
jgi:sulfur carrier protein